METLITQCSTHARTRKPFYSPKQGTAAELSLCSDPAAEHAPCATIYALEDIYGSYVLRPKWQLNFPPRNMHYASWPRDSAACLAKSVASARAAPHKEYARTPLHQAGRSRAG